MPRILANTQGRELTLWEAPPLHVERLDAAAARDAAARASAEPVRDEITEMSFAAQAELARAHEEAPAVLAQAREKGYQEGMERAQVELHAKIEALDDLVRAINERQDSFFERMQQEAVDLAVAIASKVVSHEVEADPELVVEQVRRCVRRLHQRERICVRVNAGDVETVRAAKDGIMAAYDGLQRMDVVDDYRVGKGGCVVESESGILDARLDRQINEVERVLLEAGRGGNGN